MPTIHSTPADTAAMFKRFDAIKGLTDQDKFVKSAPLPVGCRITFRDRLNKNHDQNRIHLSRSDAEKYDRVRGVIVSLKPEKDENRSKNTETPVCAQVMLRISWWDPSSEAYRSMFVRTSAYASNWTPRDNARTSCNLVRGDLISGIIQRLFPNLIPRFQFVIYSKKTPP